MSLVVRRYGKLGRGVYSTRAIRRGEVVEVSPVVPLSVRDWRAVRQTRLAAYVFAWGRDGRRNAVPLGLGGVFNHSADPNLTFWLNHSRQCITFTARRDIPAREQLTIDYGWTVKHKRRWFRRRATDT